jgi:hypothetical protein
MVPRCLEGPKYKFPEIRFRRLAAEVGSAGLGQRAKAATDSRMDGKQDR